MVVVAVEGDVLTIIFPAVVGAAAAASVLVETTLKTNLFHKGRKTILEALEGAQREVETGERKANFETGTTLLVLERTVLT